MSSASPNTVRILHIIGSPKGEHSISTRLARAFLDAYADNNPGHEVTTLDVWATNLPPVDGEMVAAKFAPFGRRVNTRMTRSVLRGATGPWSDLTGVLFSSISHFLSYW